MDKEQAKVLLSRYNNNQATPAEREILDLWYVDNLQKFSINEQEIDFDQIELELKEGIFSRAGLKTNKPQKRNRQYPAVWKRIAVAAATAIILFGAGLYYFKLNIGKELAQETALQNDAAPGRNGATLTLANGQKIRLSEAKSGQLAKDAGITINKSANGQLVYEIASGKSAAGHTNTLATARGETYKLRLPDGTQIWLNAASKLTYTTNLIKNGKRLVQLDGEAYFEVSKDKKHPFVVESKGQTVEVLGTHFNLNAYNDEPQMATTLLEGSVKVSANGKTQLIRPGQQVLNSAGRLKVNEVSLDDITDWKEGDFFLNHVDFKTAMRKIARWYDVDVVYDAAVPDDLESGGWMSRRNQLSTVLKAIEGTGLARFRIEGRTVHVFK